MFTTTTQPDSAPRGSSPAGFAYEYGDAAETATKGLKVLSRWGCAKPLFSFGVGLIFLLAFTPDIPAQVHFDAWTTENGLPQNSINDILQTRDGYLWLATEGGLARFDGTRFVVFDRSVEGIKTQRVRALLEDSKGALWVGTEDGMLIRYRNGKFKTYTAEDGLPQASAARIEEDVEGNLWVTWHGPIIAVTRFDGERFVNYKPEDFRRGLSADPAIGYPWWSQDSVGLHCLVKGRVRTYSFQRGLPKAQVIRVSADFHGNHWIQTRGAGVVKATDEKIKLYTMREGLPSNDVEGWFLEDRKGYLWFSAFGGASYRIRDGKSELLSTSTSGRFYEDHEGAIWIGAIMGLHRAREPAITLLTEREGLSHNWVYPILQGRKEEIWIGSRGINKYENGRFTQYHNSEGLPSDIISCIYQDNSGRLWVGTDAGVCYLKNGRFRSFDDGYGFLKRNVFAIHEDRAGNLWFATDKGLVTLKDGRFTERTSKDGLSHDRITALFEDRAGSLWIGAYHGLTRLKDGVFTAFTEREGFIGNHVRAIYEDGDGVLWIGTYDGGLYRLKDERLTRYTRREGLHDNGVFQILEDDAGNLWMGCNRGIYRVSRQELNDFAEGRTRSITSVVYSVKDGLSSLECNGGPQPSGLKTKDGRLWFPTMGGVAIVNPKAVRINAAPPPVIIEEFRLGDKAVDFQAGVKIPHDRNSFEIRYTAPSFIKPEQVRFKYKLEGLDQDWIEAGDRRTASFYRIPAGHYRFVVIAANNDGIWNTEGKSVEIVIIGPVWGRWWFITLVSLVLAFVIFLLYRRRVRHLREKHAMQQAFSQKLIESQESERKRIASEIHDSLGQYLLVVKNSALLGVKMAEDGSTIHEQFDEISTRTSQALEEARRIAHHLRPSYLDELGLKDALEFLIETVAGSSEIRFSTEIDPIDGVFSNEAEMSLYRIAQEGVSNVLKHSGATEATLALNLDGRKARLVIKDNGKGFVSDPREPAASRRNGFGLAGISERARILGGKEVIQSAPGQGTIITVTLIVQ
jgi:signal transduction histidine kinase/ligand-binding sensor domain-containing protein